MDSENETVKTQEDTIEKVDSIGGISSSTLKLMAMLLMLVDHIGMVLFPNVHILRCIGRLAFPIFAFQIGEGYRHTKNYAAYVIKLFVFAILSEIPFDLAIYNSVFDLRSQNVYFTLLFGLSAIKALETLIHDKDIVSKIVSLALFFVALALPVLIHSDYEIHGVLLIIALYFFRDTKILQLVSMCLIFIVFYNESPVLFEIESLGFQVHYQALCVLSLLIIWLYKGKKGVRNEVTKFIGYTFYPVHLFILWYINWIKM